MTAPTQRRFPNKWPGKCIHCGDKVPAYAGIRTRDDDGNWQTEHEPGSPYCVSPTNNPPPAPIPRGGTDVPSVWTVGDVVMVLSGDPGYTPRHAREAA
jgi:hypothetical protein